MVVGDVVEQRVVNEHRLAFAALDHAIAASVAGLHVGDEVVLERRIGDVVHQDAVVAIMLGAVADHGQLATLHQRVTRAGAARDVANHLVVVGEHVVNAVAQILDEVVLNAVAVGSVDVDAVAGFTDMVAGDQGATGVEQVNTVATVLGAHRRVALNLVADNLHVLGAVGPDAEARATQPVVAYDHAIGAAPDEDRRVHLGEVLAPVTQ